jgi:hypothetical protein
MLNMFKDARHLKAALGYGEPLITGHIAMIAALTTIESHGVKHRADGALMEATQQLLQAVSDKDFDTALTIMSTIGEVTSESIADNTEGKMTWLKTVSESMGCYDELVDTRLYKCLLNDDLGSATDDDLEEVCAIVNVARVNMALFDELDTGNAN